MSWEMFGALSLIFLAGAICGMLGTLAAYHIPIRWK
jgi:uncharacterized membrane protein YoaK (UPF0700 family)